MAQITELRREDQTRRRTSRALAAVGAVVVAAGAGWWAVLQPGGGVEGSPEPLSSPSAVATPPTDEMAAGPIVGADLTPPLTANAPAGWAVESDSGYVRMDADGAPGGASLLIGGPVREIWDPARNAIADVPDSGYVRWLLNHPSLTLVDSSWATVDGVRTRLLTFTVDRGVSTDQGLPLARNAGYGTRYPWDVVWPGETFTEAVIDVGGETMIVKAGGARNAAERAERDAALHLVLSTISIPD